ncbi:hypothetical protein MRB53_032806 [Persea americana]|uniref:Uncharacterized protein n=1 Tax=Persea americana TaxID=3435 RepID=A0ACC2KTT0_PERAE|nr:hypothetical protein MRB53_032806 [Persea americana]
MWIMAPLETEQKSYPRYLPCNCRISQSPLLQIGASKRFTPLRPKTPSFGDSSPSPKISATYLRSGLWTSDPLDNTVDVGFLLWCLRI